MNTVKPAPRGVQGTLFDLPFRDFDFKSPASARTFYGAAVEEIVAALLGLDRMGTDARFKTCYDAERDGMFYEIKSVKGECGHCIIFKKRLDNDVAAGVPLSYVFCSHTVTGARSNRQLWTELAAGKLALWVVPFRLVNELCAGLEVQKHYAPAGHGSMRYGYEKGFYRLPLARLFSFPAEHGWKSSELYGFKFGANVHALT